MQSTVVGCTGTGGTVAAGLVLDVVLVVLVEPVFDTVFTGVGATVVGATLAGVVSSTQLIVAPVDGVNVDVDVDVDGAAVFDAVVDPSVTVVVTVVTTTAVGATTVGVVVAG